MIEPKDKRTKKWKDWKADFDKQNSKGIGDVIQTVTKASGIKKVVELFTGGEDCGCDKRKQKLNKIKLRFTMQRCFTEDLYKQWAEFTKRPNKNIITYDQQLLVIEITKHLFARAFKPCSRCGVEVQNRIDQINKIYEQYQ